MNTGTSCVELTRRIRITASLGLVCAVPIRLDKRGGCFCCYLHRFFAQDLPYDLLVALALALVQSSRCLPPQARHAQNDLKIGYLASGATS